MLYRQTYLMPIYLSFTFLLSLYILIIYNVYDMYDITRKNKV